MCQATLFPKSFIQSTRGSLTHSFTYYLPQHSPCAQAVKAERWGEGLCERALQRFLEKCKEAPIQTPGKSPAPTWHLR